MRVLLLAAGFGTRLLPLTKKTPKCLMPINKQPLLDIWLERLTLAGFGPFLINSHYLHEQVEEYVRTSPYRDQISIIFEPCLRGTAGTLIDNLPFFGNEDGLLVHADNYCLEDFSKFQDAHNNRPSNCVMTMMTFRTNIPSSCGIVQIDKDGVVTNFFEKTSDPPGNLANGAIYILSPQMIDTIRSNFSDAKDFSTDVIGKFIGKIYTFETSKLLIDIGTIEAYSMLNKN